MTFGRKFFALLFGSALMWAGYFTALFSKMAGTVLSPAVFGTLIGAQVLLCIMYVGGNIWNQWIKAKHPVSGLIPPT